MQGIYLRCDEALAPLAALTALTCLEVRGDGETSRRVLPGRLRALTRLQVGGVLVAAAALELPFIAKAQQTHASRCASTGAAAPLAPATHARVFAAAFVPLPPVYMYTACRIC